MFFSEARDALRKMREDQVRDAPKVVQLWRDVLSNYPHKLGDEGLFKGLTSAIYKFYVLCTVIFC